MRKSEALLTGDDIRLVMMCLFDAQSHCLGPGVRTVRLGGGWGAGRR